MTIVALPHREFLPLYTIFQALVRVKGQGRLKERWQKVHMNRCDNVVITESFSPPSHAKVLLSSLVKLISHLWNSKFSGLLLAIKAIWSSKRFSGADHVRSIGEISTNPRRRPPPPTLLLPRAPSTDNGDFGVVLNFADLKRPAAGIWQIRPSCRLSSASKPPSLAT